MPGDQELTFNDLFPFNDLSEEGGNSDHSGVASGLSSASEPGAPIGSKFSLTEYITKECVQETLVLWMRYVGVHHEGRESPLSSALRNEQIWKSRALKHAKPSIKRAEGAAIIAQMVKNHFINKGSLVNEIETEAPSPAPETITATPSPEPSANN